MKDDPGASELVQMFIDALPGFSATANEHHANEDWSALQKVAHKLKGLGGGYGYPMLTELALKTEKAFSANELSDIGDQMAQFNTMCEKIIKGAA